MTTRSGPRPESEGRTDPDPEIVPSVPRSAPPTVKPRLTPKRPRRSTETSDYLAMVGRLVAAAGRRCADAVEPELCQLLGIRDDLDSAIQVAVDGIRAGGMSWAYIAQATGTTRQAAQMRWGRRSADLAVTT